MIATIAAKSSERPNNVVSDSAAIFADSVCSIWSLAPTPLLPREKVPWDFVSIQLKEQAILVFAALDGHQLCTLELWKISQDHIGC